MLSMAHVPFIQPSIRETILQTEQYTVTEMEEYTEIETQEYTITEIEDAVVTNDIKAGDIFSFIQKLYQEPPLSEMHFSGRLTLNKAIDLFLKFLKGTYSGRNLSKLRTYFHESIERRSLDEDQNVLPFYSGILEILARSTLSGPPLLLHQLQKITDYIREKWHKAPELFITLLEDSHFRALFSHALEDFWRSEFSILELPSMFDGHSNAMDEIIALTQSQELDKIDESEIHRLRLLQQFDERFNESPLDTCTSSRTIS